MNRDLIREMDWISNILIVITVVIGVTVAYLWPNYTWIAFLVLALGTLILLFVFAKLQIRTDDPQILKAPNTMISTGMVLNLSERTP